MNSETRGEKEVTAKPSAVAKRLFCDTSSPSLSLAASSEKVIELSDRGSKPMAYAGGGCGGLFKWAVFTYRAPEEQTISIYATEVCLHLTLLQEVAAFFNSPPTLHNRPKFALRSRVH